MNADTAQTIGNDAKLAIGAASVAAPFIPNALAQSIIILVARYGPGVIDSIEKIVVQDFTSLDDIKTVFAGVKPYSAYGIPDHPPAAEPPPVPAS